MTQYRAPFIVRDLADIDWDAELAELQKVLARYYALNGETAFAEVTKLIDVEVDWSLANPNVRRLMNDLAARVVGISETTRLDVSRIVTEGLDAGASLSDLEKQLTGLFEETYRGRAMTVARTESQVSFNRAAALGYEESGVVAYVELLDNPDHDEDYGASDGLTCATRHGLVVPLGDAQLHIEAEHPNGSLVIAPVVTLGAD